MSFVSSQTNTLPAAIIYQHDCMYNITEIVCYSKSKICREIFTENNERHWVHTAWNSEVVCYKSLYS